MKRELLLTAAYDFEAFATSTIKIERRVIWICRPVLCVNVAFAVWQLPIENWFGALAFLLDIAAAVVGCYVIQRAQGFIVDVTAARALARKTIQDLENTQENAL